VSLIFSAPSLIFSTPLERLHTGTN
jgi:hypothetical protein